MIENINISLKDDVTIHPIIILHGQESASRVFSIQEISTTEKTSPNCSMIDARLNAFFSMKSLEEEGSSTHEGIKSFYIEKTQLDESKPLVHSYDLMKTHEKRVELGFYTGKLEIISTIEIVRLIKVKYDSGCVEESLDNLFDVLDQWQMERKVGQVKEFLTLSLTKQLSLDLLIGILTVTLRAKELLGAFRKDFFNFVKRLTLKQYNADDTILILQGLE